MKPLFIIGLPRIEPYSYVEDNQFKGSHEALHYAVNYYLYDKFNINLIDLGPGMNDECFTDGSCSGTLSFLQNGSINFVRKFVQDQFPTLPINLTIGPTVRQEECHLINKPTIAVDFRAQDFIVSINQQFDYQVSVTCFILCLGFMLLVTLIKRLDLDHGSTRFSLWSLYEIAFNRHYLPVGSVTSSIGIVFSWFLFSMLLIASCTFQTGLIRSTSFQKIDTLQDILIHSLVPTAFKPRFCRFPIEKSNIPIFREIRSQLQLIDPEILNPLEIFDKMNNSNNVLIADKSLGFKFKGCLCKLNGEQEAMESPLITSEKAIDRLILSFVISSSTDRQTARTAIRFTYSAFETGNMENVQINRVDFQCARLRNYYSKCTRDTINNAAIRLTPLTVGYFNRALKIIVVAELIGFSVLLLELLFNVLS